MQSAPTTPNRVERGAPGAAGAYPGWSASAGNFPAGHWGARPGWSAVDGRPTGDSSPGRQRPPSGDARRNPREDRRTPAHRSSAGLGSRRVARLEPDQPDHALIENHGDPADLLPVEERVDTTSEPSVEGVKTLGMRVQFVLFLRLEEKSLHHRRCLLIHWLKVRWKTTKTLRLTAVTLRSINTNKSSLWWQKRYLMYPARESSSWWQKR